MSMFEQTLTIERATAGSVDGYNQPSETYATVATVKGLVQPKGAVERAQLNQAGAVVADFNIYLPLSTDVFEADRVIYEGGIFEIKGIERRDYGRLAHLKANAQKVTA